MTRYVRFLSASAIVVGAGTALWYYSSAVSDVPVVLSDDVYGTYLPRRDAQWASLRRGTRDRPFDVLIVGGGATGAGCCVDAATRGLNTALVEAEDFGAGTSSRSTKLVHGGVRYLEKAVFQQDFGQLKLVFEALRERKRLLLNAPFLTSSLPIMTPCYQWWEIPYYWSGLKAYDFIAGSQGLTASRFLPWGESKLRFPTLAVKRADGSTLKGSVLYYDGQFDDARLNVTLITTAALAGATVLNHAPCIGLIKDKDRVIGAAVRDALSGEESEVYARVVINAAGPFTDHIRKLADPKKPELVLPSAGVHVTLPDYYSADSVGMIVPKTKDGRVVFMLPWLGHTIAGTTDSSSEICMLPTPTDEEVEFILDSIKDYLTVKVRKSDVLSAWSGIRPLAKDPSAGNTENTSRDHVVLVEDGMVTISGGKWTTYRKMAEDAIDVAISVGDLSATSCCTQGLKLNGSVHWTPTTFTEIAQNYVVPHRPGAIDTRVAHHLSQSYGDRAGKITRIAEERKLGQRLVRGHPMLEAEVVYTVQNEYCMTIVDFLARRTRLAFLDTLAARQAIPKVADLMAQELQWSPSKKKKEIEDANDFLDTFAFGEESKRPAFAK